MTNLWIKCCFLAKNFSRNTLGATAIEYGLIVALIAVALIISLTVLGIAISDMFTSTSSTLDQAVNGR